MQEERVMAVMNPLMNTYDENRLISDMIEIEGQITELEIDSDEQYEAAGAIGVMLREKMAEVTDFFAPMKKAAHDAHKQICEREKFVLAPLKRAEIILKSTMGAYNEWKESERRLAEAEARRIAACEAEKRLSEAVNAESSGDAETALTAFMDAEMADAASRNVCIESEEVKTKGVISKKDWEITAIDPTKVPVTICGQVIRPVDTKAVLALIRQSEGTVQIDGITYKETNKVTFRRG